MARTDRSPRRTTRLDQPKVPGRQLRPTVDPEWFGQLSERIARFMGTARFLVYMTVFIVLWLAWNTLAPRGWRFDPYTFTFLTLLLSLQASYAAPLILLAQNRQDDRDRANLAQDRDQNARLLADAEYLTREVASLRVSVGEVVTRDYLRAELRAFLEELDADESDDGHPRLDKPRADKPRGEKARSEKPRSDKARSDRPRTDKPRGVKQRGEKARTDKPRDKARESAAASEHGQLEPMRAGDGDGHLGAGLDPEPGAEPAELGRPAEP
jgi:uncharacterized membrane protein